MDHEVASRLTKLQTAYRLAEAQLNSLAPRGPLGARSRVVLQTNAVKVLGQLRDARRPQVAAMLRLAYVRSMRTEVADARMSDIEEAEVILADTVLGVQLAELERVALQTLDGIVRRYSLSAALESPMNPLPEHPVRVWAADRVTGNPSIPLTNPALHLLNREIYRMEVLGKSAKLSHAPVR